MQEALQAQPRRSSRIVGVASLILIAIVWLWPTWEISHFRRLTTSVAAEKEWEPVAKHSVQLGLFTYFAKVSTVYYLDGMYRTETASRFRWDGILETSLLSVVVLTMARVMRRLTTRWSGP
jgi:hypothetical protein